MLGIEDHANMEVFLVLFIGFRVTKNKVDLQQNHRGMKVQINAIIPSSKGFNFKMRAHLSWFGIFIMRVLSQCQI